MTVNKCKFPPCFGKIEVVFPLKENGLREVPASCMPCFYRVNCIKSAVNGKEGINIKQEINDRAYSSGSVTFLQRWSRRKILQQRKKEK